MKNIYVNCYRPSDLPCRIWCAYCWARLHVPGWRRTDCRCHVARHSPWQPNLSDWSAIWSETHPTGLEKKKVFHGEFLRKMISTSATFSSCLGDKFVNTSYKWFTLMILLKEIKKWSDLEWPAIDGLSTFPCSSGISPLNNEVTHHSVKHCAIVVTLRIERYQTIR